MVLKTGSECDAERGISPTGLPPVLKFRKKGGWYGNRKLKVVAMTCHPSSRPDHCSSLLPTDCSPWDCTHKIPGGWDSEAPGTPLWGFLEIMDNH